MKVMKETVSDSPFKLTPGRIIPHEDATHNGSWFNQKGEKVGWGDLSYLDLKRVADNLEEGDAFIVLREHESFWDAREAGLDPEELPTEYIAQHARFVVVPKLITRLAGKYDHNFKPGVRHVWARGQVEYETASRAYAYQILGLKAP